MLLFFIIFYYFLKDLERIRRFICGTICKFCGYKDDFSLGLKISLSVEKIEYKSNKIGTRQIHNGAHIASCQPIISAAISQQNPAIKRADIDTYIYIKI